MNKDLGDVTSDNWLEMRLPAVINNVSADNAASLITTAEADYFRLPS